MEDLQKDRNKKTASKHGRKYDRYKERWNGQSQGKGNDERKKKNQR